MLVFARTEALVVGLDKFEALDRTKAYEQAGADAILIPSAEKEVPHDILYVCREWKGRAPMVILLTNLMTSRLRT